MNYETLQKIWVLGGLLFTIGFCVIIFLILRRICKGFKNFLFDLIDHANGTAPRSDTGKTKYTYEARRACDDVTPKQKQGTKPPWEE